MPWLSPTERPRRERQVYVFNTAQIFTPRMCAIWMATKLPLCVEDLPNLRERAASLGSRLLTLDAPFESRCW